MAEPLSAVQLLQSLQAGGATGGIDDAGGTRDTANDIQGSAYSQLQLLLSLTQGATPVAAQSSDEFQEDSTQRLALLAQLSQAFAVPDATSLAVSASASALSADGVTAGGDESLRALLAALHQPSSAAAAVLPAPARVPTPATTARASAARGGATTPDSDTTMPTLDSAREKNRQAQRRFRERQKNLISELRAQLEDSQQANAALREENAALREQLERFNAGGVAGM